MSQQSEKEDNSNIDPQSHGFVQFSNGDSYHGEISNGKKNGQGEYKFSNGDVYNGNFVDG